MLGKTSSMKAAMIKKLRHADTSVGDPDDLSPTLLGIPWNVHLFLSPKHPKDWPEKIMCHSDCLLARCIQ